MFESAESLLVTAFVLGFTAGISPGVLFAVIVSESLQHGASAGIKIAIAPLLTDAPIVLLCMFIFSQLSEVTIILAMFSFAGGLYICYLGYKNLTVLPDFSGKVVKSNSIRKGIITNVLSPGPYVFWMSIGAPMLSNSFELSLSVGIGFLLVFYFFLVGVKILIAIITAKMKKFTGSKLYVIIIRGLGFVLIGLGCLYIYNGIIQL